MFIIFTVLLRKLEAPKVYLKIFYCSVTGAVTLNSYSVAPWISNAVLRKRQKTWD